MNTLQKMSEKLVRDRAYKIDTYVKLHIKPKPKYLPKFVWNWLLKKLLILEQI